MGDVTGTRPHHAWLRYALETPPDAVHAKTMRHVAVSIHHVESGSVSGRWIYRGRERPSSITTGFIRIYPADGDEHVVIGRAGDQGLRYSTLVIPASDLQACADADDVGRLPDLHVAEWPDDVRLQQCLRVLTSTNPDEDHDHDAAARGLVLRLAELLGGRPPEWTLDASGFSNRQLVHLVAYVDAHLRTAPSAADMALLCGLSPSHFARKFRRSTGLSLHRFVNRRRILASLDRIPRREKPLADLALDLGFSSQSHFTRLFTGCVGITPDKYRRQFHRTVG